MLTNVPNAPGAQDLMKDVFADMSTDVHFQEAVRIGHIDSQLNIRHYWYRDDCPFCQRMKQS